MDSFTSSPPRSVVPSAEPSAAERRSAGPPRPSAQRDRRSSALRFAVFNVLIPCGILALGGLAWWAFGVQQAAVRPADDQSLAARLARIPAVETLPIRSLESVGGQLELEVDGVVVPYREVQIAAEVAGQIIYKAPECEAGTYVEQGQLLVRIDPTDYQHEIDRLTQLKEQEYQSIRELEQELVNTERLIELAKEDVALQEKEIARLEKLPAGFASAAEMDQAQQRRLQSVNTRVGLENQIALLQRRRERLEAAEQLVATQLQLARTNLERTEIRSPVSGVVFREDAELNSFVQRGAVIVTIEDTRKAEVAINLRTDQLYWVLDQARQGSDALVPPGAHNARSYSLPETKATILYQVAGREDEVFEWDGVLRRYDGIGVDPVSRTVPVRLVVENPRRYRLDSTGEQETIAPAGPSALVRGMFVTVVLHVQPQRSLVVIPAVGLKPGNRVWKFVPDPSVLQVDEKIEEQPRDVAEELVAAEQAERDDAADEQISPDERPAAEEQELNPDDWVAGRLVVLENIRPIQASDLAPGVAGDAGFEPRQDGDPNYWVCEVGQGELEPGSRVVISPLPSFQGSGSDVVRVPAAQLRSSGGEVAVAVPAHVSGAALAKGSSVSLRE